MCSREHFDRSWMCWCGVAMPDIATLSAFDSDPDQSDVRHHQVWCGRLLLCLLCCTAGEVDGDFDLQVLREFSDPWWHGECQLPEGHLPVPHVCLRCWSSGQLPCSARVPEYCRHPEKAIYIKGIAGFPHACAHRDTDRSMHRHPPTHCHMRRHPHRK